MRGKAHDSQRKHADASGTEFKNDIGHPTSNAYCCLSAGHAHRKFPHDPGAALGPSTSQLPDTCQAPLCDLVARIAGHLSVVGISVE